MQQHQAVDPLRQVERELTLEPEAVGVEARSVRQRRDRQADVVDHFWTTSPEPARTGGGAPLRSRDVPRSHSPRSRSPSLTSGGGGLAAIPSGCLIAVSGSARPATNSWYLPTLKALSSAVTNSPVDVSITPATTAPAIRPTLAT